MCDVDASPCNSRRSRPAPPKSRTASLMPSAPVTFATRTGVGRWAPAVSSLMEPDEVEAGERAADLLQRSAGGQVAEVDRGEARVLEEFGHFGFRVLIVARE